DYPNKRWDEGYKRSPRTSLNPCHLHNNHVRFITTTSSRVLTMPYHPFPIYVGRLARLLLVTLREFV
ncbi:hypothetical protein J6590_008797, partial [Homalodisca vitripennis]